MLWRWLWSHVDEEISEAGMPPLAHTDTPASVVLPAGICPLVTAFPHVLPSTEFRAVQYGKTFLWNTMLLSHDAFLLRCGYGRPGSRNPAGPFRLILGISSRQNSCKHSII